MRKILRIYITTSKTKIKSKFENSKIWQLLNIDKKNEIALKLRNGRCS